MDWETFLERSKARAEALKKTEQADWHRSVMERKEAEPIEHIFHNCFCSAENLPVFDGGFHSDGYCRTRPFV